MSNIAISELNTTATSLNDEDLILVSKTEDNGNSFTSAKMKGSVLKSQVGGCQFTDTKYNNLISMMTNLQLSNAEMLSKINSIQDTQSIHSQYFAQITANITNIGNKVYEETLGGDITLTLTYDSNIADAPTINPTSSGNVYAKNSRVTLIAGSVKNIWLYKFDGWYQGSTKLSSLTNFSYEVTVNVTIEAKYSRISDQFISNVGSTFKNETNYTVGIYNGTNWVGVYQIEPGQERLVSNSFDFYKIGYDTRFITLHVKNPNNNLPYTNKKIKLLSGDTNFYCNEYTGYIRSDDYAYACNIESTAPFTKVNDTTYKYIMTSNIRIVNA